MQRERIAVVEATLDDMNPEIYDYVIDRLFAQGALEVRAGFPVGVDLAAQGQYVPLAEAQVLPPLKPDTVEGP